MPTNRLALGGLMLAAGLSAVAFTGPARAQPGGEVFKSAEGKFSARFPGKPKENTQTAKSDLGSLSVYTATVATTDGNVYLVSYTDFPPGTVKPENYDALFDGVRDGLKKGGTLVSEKPIEVGPEKLKGREILVEKEAAKDKPKQLVRFRVMVRENRLYQVAVVGTEEFVKGKDATAFLDSFEVTR